MKLFSLFLFTYSAVAQMPMGGITGVSGGGGASPAYVSTNTSNCDSGGAGGGSYTCGIPVHSAGTRIFSCVHTTYTSVLPPAAVPTDDKSGGTNTYSNHTETNLNLGVYQVACYSAVDPGTSATTITYSGLGFNTVHITTAILSNTTAFDHGAGAINAGGTTYTSGNTSNATGTGIAVGISWARGGSGGTLTPGAGWTKQQEWNYTTTNTDVVLQTRATSNGVAYASSGTFSTTAFIDTVIAIFK